MDALADPPRSADWTKTTRRSMAKFMRKMSGEMGEEMGPEFDEMVGRLESGESPEEIEKSMPEMGGMGDDGGMGMGGMGWAVWAVWVEWEARWIWAEEWVSIKSGEPRKSRLFIFCERNVW